MKKLLILAMTIVVCSTAFADTMSNSNCPNSNCKKAMREEMQNKQGTLADDSDDGMMDGMMEDNSMEKNMKQNQMKKQPSKQPSQTQGKGY